MHLKTTYKKIEFFNQFANYAQTLNKNDISNENLTKVFVIFDIICDNTNVGLDVLMIIDIYKNLLQNVSATKIFYFICHLCYCVTL